MHLQLGLVAGLLVGAVASLSDCGAPQPAHELRSLSLKTRAYPTKPQSKVTVDTYIHVVAASNKVEDGYYSDNLLKKEIALLNKEYAAHAFGFKLKEIDRTINASWADFSPGPGRPKIEPTVKAALRKGTYADLNIYFIADMVPGGKAELPMPDPTPANVTNDGAVIRPVEAGTQNPTFESVTVHEVGHWLGLFHTFEVQPGDGNVDGCDGPGDYVDDTPAEAYPVGNEADCPPPGRDTCPDLPGLDPLDNYMTYVNDKCGPKKFTKGQAARMHQLWTELRLPFRK